MEVLKDQRLGRHVITRFAGEEVRAFVPPPLPPVPPVQLESVQVILEEATLSLGRLDALGSILPDLSQFIYAYVRKEAVLSSQIEGTQSSLSDLLVFENDETPGAPLHDVEEVLNYVAALNHGLQRLREGFPLSLRLIREIHGVLLSGGRGAEKMPGEFRTSQNWIGGSRPGDAVFVPPPPDLLMDCLGPFESFLHDESPGIPLLVRAGLMHVQFESIHPFLDGNGRLGRLLITFLLCARRALAAPILYLSLFLKQNRQTYYDLLTRVRENGDWEAWLAFFLQGIRETADQALETAQRILRLYEQDRTRIAELGRPAGSALRVFQYAQTRPILSIKAAAARTGLAFATVGTALEHLRELGIFRELTGRQRSRLFVYSSYLAILDEGMEPLPRGA